MGGRAASVAPGAFADAVRRERRNHVQDPAAHMTRDGSAVTREHPYGPGSVTRPRLMWVARGLFVAPLPLLFGLTLLHVSDAVARALFGLVFVIMLAGFLCGVAARRGGTSQPTTTRRQRYRTASVVLISVVFLGLAGLPIVPRAFRLVLLPILLLVLVAVFAFLLLAQPTREESHQTDLSKPSPRGRIGLALLVMFALMIGIQMVQHALS
jgi:hypothetical protein